ncbi:MAG TPA: arylsulfotransferase family protein [Gaiellaceae bacterium]|nr:arylsulfotransferase family protein [Gaiellaceae bacterium]
MRWPAALLAAATIALAGCGHSESEPATTTTTAAAPPPTQHFHSRPDLRPPVVKVLTPAHGTAPGYIFLAPKMEVAQAGPMIVDNKGQVIWFHPLQTKGVTDFKVQRYLGKPVLTWWRGHLPGGYGNGSYFIYDTSYHQVAEVRAGNGLAGDVHEFLITPRSTAMFTVYHQLHVDLSPYGGPKQGRILEGVIQEVNIKTGKVLFEWHSYPQISLNESYVPVPPAKQGAKAEPWDYMHINSIDIEPNGNLLVSGRNTHALYEVDRKTGKILWRMGGKKSDFKMGPGTNFEWQHDARRQPNGTITLFDNGAAPPVERFTRILVLDVNTAKKRVSLVRSYHHPKKLLTPFEGNAQFLPNGNVFVGWGANPYYTEFSKSGRVLLDAYFGHGQPPGKDADSYRVFRFVWQGQPTEKPAVAVSGQTVYVSWNGATKVARWQVLAGTDAQHLKPVRTASKNGFETAIDVSGAAPYVAVRALDRSGHVLAVSAAVKRS